jgi:hypothetical protein
MRDNWDIRLNVIMINVIMVSVVAPNRGRITYLLDGCLVDSVLDNGLLGPDDKVGRVDSLPENVGGPAGVGSGVLGVDVHDVERHEAEVEAFPESGPLKRKND